VVVRLLIGRPIERGLDLLAAEHRLVEVPDEALRRGVGLLGRVKPSEFDSMPRDFANATISLIVVRWPWKSNVSSRCWRGFAPKAAPGASWVTCGVGAGWPTASPPSGLAGPGGSRAA
jgi:hypothetical protein